MNDENKDTVDTEKKSLTLRNVLLGILIAIIILFPTSLAIINIAYVDSGRSASSDRASTVVLYSADGEELYREDASEGLTGDTSLISIFNTIRNNLTSTAKISENTVTSDPIVVKITDKEGTQALTFYFLSLRAPAFV